MDMIAAVAAKKLGKYLAKDFREIFGSGQNDEAERLGALARTTIEWHRQERRALPHVRNTPCSYRWWAT